MKLTAKIKANRTKVLILTTVVVFGAVAAGKWFESSRTISSEVANYKTGSWYCPMHTHIRSDGPGKCPICGMDFVHDEDSSGDKQVAAESNQEDHQPVKLNEYRRQMIGLTFETVEKKPLFRKISAAGRVAFDPDLYTAQSEYVEAMLQKQRLRDSPIEEAKHSADRMLDSARLRLKVLGLSDHQISQLSSKGADVSNLIIPKSGQKIWVYAEVFEMDLPLVSSGLDADLNFGRGLAAVSKGKVISVDRLINPVTRTAKVRIAAVSGGEALRGDSFVDVSILVPLDEQLVVDTSAIIDTGKAKWVFKDMGDGLLVPTPVIVKYFVGDEAAISDGLQVGDRIVKSGNFLLDSESRMTAAKIVRGMPND